MRIFVINLAFSTDRLAMQTNQLQSLDLNFIRFNAIDAAQAQNWGESVDWDRWQRPLKITERAALLSHRQVWEQIFQHGEPALVLEDDAIVSADLPDFLNKAAGCIGIDHISIEARDRRKLMGRSNHSEYPDLRRLWLDRSGAAAYILWPEGARKLLQRSARIPALADATIVETPGIVSYQAIPALAVQADRCATYGLHAPISDLSLIKSGEPFDPSTNSRFTTHKQRTRRILAQLKMGARQVSQFRRASMQHVPISPNWPIFE